MFKFNVFAFLSLNTALILLCLNENSAKSKRKSSVSWTLINKNYVNIRGNRDEKRIGESGLEEVGISDLESTII